MTVRTRDVRTRYMNCDIDNKRLDAMACCYPPHSPSCQSTAVGAINRELVWQSSSGRK